MLSANTAYAETPAGDRVNNTAAINYVIDGTAQSTPSNTDTIIVAERLDVALVRGSTGTILSSTSAIPVLLTNAGNGQEAFRLSARDDRDTTFTRFAIDVDGNGRYDADRDTLLADAVTPALAPGASLALLLLADDDKFDGNQVTIVTQAVTGFGAVGTLFAGRGDGGGDAVVGPTGAQAQVVVPIVTDTAPVLTKTQSVLAPDGSASVIRGAVVTYTLSAAFTEAVAGARIDDPWPAGTTYVPGSLSLDGQSLSDAADADAGQATTSAIAVALGDIAGAAIRTVQFRVQIQ